MKKIVITGGLGYIGTELCKIYSGYSWNDKITVIDNRFISERVNQIRNWNMNFIHGDILNKELSLKRHFLAFPFGSKADFNDEIIKRVLSSGFERCLLNVQGYNIQENNEFSLKRRVISNDTNLKYILG